MRPIVIRILLVAFSVGTFSCLNAQEARVDSLVNLLKTAKGNERLTVLNELTPEILDRKEAEPYAKEALSLAKQFKASQAEVDAFDNLGMVYSFRDNYDEASRNFQRGLELSRKIGYFKGEMNILINIGQNYYLQDNIEEAEKFANEVLVKAKSKKDEEFIAYAYHELGRYCLARGSLDSASILLQNAYRLREKQPDLRKLARTADNLGEVYYQLGKFDSSLTYYTQCLKIGEKQHDTYGVAFSLFNVGRCEVRQGNYQAAIKPFQDASTYFEKIGEKVLMANCLFHIGTVYENLVQSEMSVESNRQNFNKALEYYQSALNIFKENDEKQAIANCMVNIGNVYTRLASLEFTSHYGENWEDSIQKISERDIEQAFLKGKDAYNQALQVYQSIDDVPNSLIVYINLAKIAGYERQYSRSVDYNLRVLKTGQTLGLTYQMALAYYGLAEVSYRRGNFLQAIDSYKQCLRLAKQNGMREIKRYIYQRLSLVYEKLGQPQESLDYLKLFIAVKDSIFSEESQKNISELQTRYETEKKEQAIKQLNTETALQNSVIQRQRLMIFTFIAGFLLILVFVILLFKLYRKIKSANKLLNEKNLLISHQKQEITDSIRYASRIQTSVLPPLERFNRLLPASFVLFLPRDIVSGDFYWITARDGKTIVVAADCTGHGVPGAFMSMLGVSFLDEIVMKEAVVSANLILDHLRESVKRTLSQTGKKDEQKDGMDISICIIDPATQKVEFSGAYNPLYLVRNGELFEYKADKMPIGIHLTDNEPFSCQVIDYHPGDSLFIFSDGYADQFGGEDGRKFMTKPFKRLLTEISSLPVEQQREKLLQTHLDWKGDNDQVDDILVIGFKL